jgi:invasion protein IalB
MKFIRFLVPAIFATAATAPAARAAEPAAPPPVSAEPQTTTSTYGDWTVRCTRTDAAPGRLCEVADSVQGQQGPIAQIVISRIIPKDPPHIIVQLPLNVSFPSSVKVSIDEKDAQSLDLSWRKCLPAGCFADAELKDDMLKKLRAQTANGKIQFKDGNGRELALPISFRGFSQAMDGLGKAQ